MTQTQTPPEADTGVDLLELEIARKVVLPRLRDLAKQIDFSSKNHMYNSWVDRWGPLSRAKFDTWLDLLQISFEKIVVVRGLEETQPSVSSEVVRRVGTLNDEFSFDNERNGDV